VEGYLKELKEYWTHDLVKLVNLAGLDAELGLARSANPALDRHWKIVKEWKETSRYEIKTEAQTRDLSRPSATNRTESIDGYKHAGRRTRTAGTD
jgi:hypothetical protein